MEAQKLTELVINAQKGDKIAIDTIVSETYQELYYYVLKTVKNEDLAYDVTQESFIEIITTIENLREPAAFPLWARRIAYHKCALHFRQSKEIIIEENDDGETIFDQLPDVSEDTLPEAVVEDEEFRTTLLNMINSLPAEQTNALLLYYYEKRSVGEIAEIQGVTQGTVKSRLNYARKAIKGKVEEHESKTGTKLYSFTLLPLLLYFIFQGEKASIAPVEVSSAVTAATTAGAANTAAATASTVATETVAATAGSAIVGKIIAGVIAVAVVAGGIGFGFSKLSKKEETGKPTATATAENPGNNPAPTAENSSAPTASPMPDLVPSEGLSFAVYDTYCYVHSFGTCKDTVLVVPETYEGLPVIGIGSYAFSDNTFYNKEPIELKKIYLPKTVTRICSYAFYNCISLEAVYISASEPVQLEKAAFSHCTSLKYIDLNKVTTPDNYAFSNCLSLNQFTIKEGSSTVGQALLLNCTELKSITIPVDLKEIPLSMCYKCINLTDIYYEGTVAQWAKIQQNAWHTDRIHFDKAWWWEETGEFTVHCADGDIAKKDAIVSSYNTSLEESLNNNINSPLHVQQNVS